MSTEQSVLDAVFFIFRAYGVVIVISFLCASVIWGIVQVLSRSNQALTEKKKSSAVAKPAPVSVPTSVSASAPSAVAAAPAPVREPAVPGAGVIPVSEQVEDDIPKDHIAIISAICAVLEVRPRKIIRVDHSRRFGAWVVGGRNDHMASHRPVRR